MARPAALTRALVALLLLVLLVGACAPQAAASPAPLATAGPTDWRDQSIYFVMTDRFRNGDPRNDGDARPGDPRWWQGGDLRGVIDELDYIKGLGMSAIWLTPVTKQMPGGYHGYWTEDFYRIDPHLGDMATLQELVRQAHRRSMKVILDVVLNHVGYDSPWLTDGKHEGWFHPRCTVSDSDQQSVERCWLAGLPDLNTENPDVRRYLEDWSLWLIAQTGVDGFRLDTARNLPKDFIAEWARHVHQAHPGFWILGEVWSSDYRYQDAYLAAGLDAVTDFYTYDNVRRALGGSTTDLAWLRLPAPVAESYLTHGPVARATFVDNHDVPRFVGPRADEAARERLRVALVDLFTQPGTPVLYYGTEVALAGGADPDNRRMMPWSGEIDTTTRDLVRRLANLRAATPALRRGAYEKLDASATSYVFLRRLSDGVAVVAMNAGDQPMERTFAADDVRIPAAYRPSPGLGPDGSATLEDGALRMALPGRRSQVWVFAPGRP